jgi:hypothetical protein
MHRKTLGKTTSSCAPHHHACAVSTVECSSDGCNHLKCLHDVQVCIHDAPTLNANRTPIHARDVGGFVPSLAMKSKSHARRAKRAISGRQQSSRPLRHV